MGEECKKLRSQWAACSQAVEAGLEAQALCRAAGLKHSERKLVKARRDYLLTTFRVQTQRALGDSTLSLRAKGALISEPRFSLRDAIFPTRERENGLCQGFVFEKAVFPFSRGKNRISQGVENRGSLISAPLGPQGF